MNRRYILGLLSTMLIVTYTHATVYEDGDTTRCNWGKLNVGNVNVVEENGNSLIEFQSNNGIGNGFVCGYGNTAWDNTSEKILKWRMKYSENYEINVRVMTKNGFRFLKFTPTATINQLGRREVYSWHKLGIDSKNGEWQKFEIDLEQHLKKYEPTNEIISVNGIIFRGTGKVDNIELTDIPSTPNEVPTAQISVGVDGNIVEVGESGEIYILFTGEGDDSDGYITYYEWRDSNDNVLFKPSSTTCNGYDVCTIEPFKFQINSTTNSSNSLKLVVTDNGGAIANSNIIDISTVIGSGTIYIP